MNTRTSYALIAILAAVGTMTFTSAYAQQLPCPKCVGEGGPEEAMAHFMELIPITVWTDRSAYDHESTILVEGTVANIKPDTPITLTVISPTNNIVTIQQIDVMSDRTYSTNLSTAGNLWKYDGTYTIRVQYGGQETNNRALVELTDGVISGPTGPAVECRSSEITANGYCIPYTITGASVTEASIDTSSKSIVIEINSFNDGTLMINPSTDVIDGIFMVLVDGEEWDDAEINGSQVIVMFPAGTEEIEVIGTFVIPEFGTIAVMILAVAIISIVAVSARSRLSIMPKY